MKTKIISSNSSSENEQKRGLWKSKSQAKLLNRHTDRKRTVSLPHLKCLQLLNSSTCTTTKTKLIPKSKPIGFYLLIKNINSFQFITMVKSIEVFILTTLDCTKIIWKIEKQEFAIVLLLKGSCPTGIIVEDCVFQQYDFWVSVPSYKSFRIFDNCNLTNFLYEFLSNVGSLMNNTCTSFHKLYRQIRNHLFL